MNNPAPVAPRHCDVLVVGGGPSGAACTYWLASAGYDVVMVERKHYPREKTCGDGLTPRSVRQLEDMGLADELAGAGHRFQGLRSHGFGRTLELDLAPPPGLPRLRLRHHPQGPRRPGRRARRQSRRHRLGGSRSERTARGSGLRPRRLGQGQERSGGGGGADTGADAEYDGPATGPVPVRARYTVVADGANSRFGRSLGTSRNRAFPQGMAIRGYWTSPRHDEPWIDSWLDIRDKAGNVLPGYGWIFPVGDGRINVGIGLLSTFNQWKAVNTTHLLQAFAEYAPPSWEIRPETACGPATGGRLPMGMSVGPRVGPTWLAIGDAGGAINPFNGEGIAYAYETGRFAADAVALALASGDGLALRTYQQRVEEAYALYYKVARAFVRLIGRPELMKVLATTGMRSRTLMEWVLRIMANLLRPEELGPAEAAYRAVAAVARLVPEAA